jgi:hypothetical protein
MRPFVAGFTLVASVTWLVAGGPAGQSGHPATADVRSASGTTPSRLRVAGGEFIGPDGRPFAWRGVTAFALVEQVAHGREVDARRFLRWARDTGFTIVRVLTMESFLYRLEPADGIRSLPKVLELAGQHGLAVEVVALSDTADFPKLDLAGHVAAVGRTVAAYPHAVVELANEPYHPGQRRGLDDARLLGRLRSVVAPEVAVAFGAHASDESDAYRDGDFVTVHLSRAPPQWTQVERVGVLGALARRTGKPVVNDEPVGAGEKLEPGRRWVASEAFFALGLMNRLYSVGGTFHFDDGLHARVPGPNQQAAARAFVEGMRLLPDGIRPVPVRDEGPVASFDPKTVRSVHAAGAGDRVWVAALGVSGEPRIGWRAGWRVVRVTADRPGVRVWELSAQK